MKTTACSLAAAVLVAVASAGAAAAVPAHEGLPAEIDARYTPAVGKVMSTPRWFRAIDGRRHLAYELSLVNGFPVPVTVTRIAVVDTGRDRTVEVLAGKRLAAATSLMASPGAPETKIPASSTAIVWLDIPMGAREPLPARLAHRITVRVPPGLPVPDVISYTGARASVDRRPPVVISPPLVGSGWLAVGSCCDGPHRRALQPVDGELHLGQRFAIDFNRLTPDDRIVDGPADRNESYPTYAQPVVAVADARVVSARDGIPDQIPNAPTPVGLDTASGNNVILDLGGGRFAEFAHLMPGSVRVERGDRVMRGQVLGLAGNSGSSSGPHMHFQVMDAPSAVASDGLPYVFDSFVLEGETPPLTDALVESAMTGEPLPVDRSQAGPRAKVLPLGRDLMEFRAP